MAARHAVMTRDNTDWPPAGTTAEQLREEIENAVPFNLHNHVHIDVIEPGRGVATIPDVSELHNHLGTVHGAALFAVAEAAAGAALLGVFAQHLTSLRINAQGAEITYHGWARGEIVACASLAVGADAVLSELHDEKNPSLRIDAEAFDCENTKVAHVTFHFRLERSKEAS